jgi:heat shock protein HslJ
MGATEMARSGKSWLAGILAAAMLMGCDAEPSAVKPRVDSSGSASNPSVTSPSTTTSSILSAADRQVLVGRWEPTSNASPSTKWRTPPHVEFSADGSWRGTDGCNDQSGRWTIGTDGAFKAIMDGSALVGCDAVEVGIWLDMARTASVDGSLLILNDARGAEVGRLRRTPA